ncbi:MAG: hypothetical protein ACRC4K_15915 [Plesiomonas shigelloides]
MQKDTSKSPITEEVLTTSNDEIQEILLDVYKETGQKISHDDPVLAVAVSSRLFIERLSGVIKSDIEACYGAWERVINESEERHIERLNSIIRAVDNIESESKAHITKLSEQINNEREKIVEVGGRTKEAFRQEASQVLAEMKDELKKQAEHYKPLKKSTIFGFAFGVALAISAAFSAGIYLYLSNKADIEIGKANAELKTVLGSAQKLLDLTEKTINALPAKQQSAAKKELQQIIK